MLLLKDKHKVMGEMNIISSVYVMGHVMLNTLLIVLMGKGLYIIVDK